MVQTHSKLYSEQQQKDVHDFACRWSRILELKNVLVFSSVSEPQTSSLYATCSAPKWFCAYVHCSECFSSASTIFTPIYCTMAITLL